MMLKIGNFLVGLAADVTAVDLFVRVGQHVFLHVAPAAKRLSTCRTREGLLTGMGPQVIVKIPEFSESFPAYHTYVRPLSRVNPYMLFQIARTAKGFSACGTAKWSWQGIGPDTIRFFHERGRIDVGFHMLFEISLSLERLSANRTLVQLLGMGHDVFVDVVDLGEGPVTDATDEEVAARTVEEIHVGVGDLRDLLILTAG